MTDLDDAPAWKIAVLLVCMAAMIAALAPFALVNAIRGRWSR